MFGVGVGIRVGGFTPSGGIDAQAQAHYDRVIADGGVVPSGSSGVNAFYNAVKTIYGTTDITTAVSVGLDAQYLGYKLGAGAGATSGQAVQKLYSCAGSSGDVVQTTAASQPLLLAHSGASSDNYWYGSGVGNNFCSTPSASANQITGDIEIIVDVQTNNWTPSIQSTLVSKWKDTGGSNYSYLVRLMADGSLRLLTSPDGSNAVDAVSDASVPFSNGDKGYLKFVRDVNNGAGGNSTYFYTSTDRINWTQLGSTITSAGTTSIFAGTTPLQIGANDTNGTLNPFIGSIYRATIANSIGGTPVVDFNPSSYNASTSQTQWTSTTGEVWTINTGTATTGYKGVLVDRTTTQGDGIDDFMQSGTLTSFTVISTYAALKVFTTYPAARHIGGSDSANDHIIYGQGGTLEAYNNASMAFVGETLNKLDLYTINFNGGSSSVKVNDANNVSGNLGSASSTKVTLFADGNTAQSGNSCANTLIYSTIDSSKNTAMYNYIRSINNNAF